MTREGRLGAGAARTERGFYGLPGILQALHRPMYSLHRSRLAARLAVATLTCALANAAPAPQGGGGADGWVSLFDGATLAGWTPVGGPYDGNAAWTVEDGAIVGREGANHAGGLLYTEALYGDHEFECDAWVSYPFDSGVFVRMLTGQRGVQATLDYRDGGEIGGIYSNGYLFHNTEGKAKWRRDEWNAVRVRCVGDPPHVVVWLNGELITDFQVPGGLGTFAPKGRVGIQVHGDRADPAGSKVMFKRLRVRELPEGAGAYFSRDAAGFLRLTAVGEAVGWQPLFNGRDLTGWQAEGGAEGYRVRDGVLEFLKDGGSPHLATERDFEDFQLRLDFKTARLANSGLFLRAARDGSNPAFSGAEVQILDDHNWEAAKGKLKPWQFSGGLYGAVAPGPKDALRPIGEWNTYELTVVGPRMMCALNGKILWDVDTATLTPEQGAAFAERAKRGFIGLQRHADPRDVEGDAFAWFRNVFVREL